MRIAAAIVVLLLCINQARAEVSPEQIDQQANQVFMSVMSPYCPGRLLANCPSSAATELKNKVKESLRTGASTESIIEDLVKNFGPESRAAPPNAGFGRLAWLVPVVFLAIGALFIFSWLKANSKQGVQSEEQDYL